MRREFLQKNPKRAACGTSKSVASTTDFIGGSFISWKYAVRELQILKEKLRSCSSHGQDGKRAFSL
jgi:hypothetical protein